MKRQSIIFGSLLAVTLVVVAGALAVRTMASPERIVREAQDRLREKTGRELSVGSLDVRYLPRPAILARDVEVSGFGKAESVTATLQLLPLLMGRVRPAAIGIDNGVFDAKAGSDWKVDRARLDSGLDGHDVAIEGTVSRNGQTANIKGRFADLSGIGKSGETTRGRIEVDWGETHMAADGDFRLDGMRGHALKVSARTETLDDVFAFVGVTRDRTAPLEIDADVRDDGKTIHLADIRARLGKMHLKGAGTVVLGGEAPLVEAQLAADRLEWKQALVDMGHARKPEEPSNVVFRDNQLAWRTIGALASLRGKIEFTAASLKLGNGVELQQPRARLAFGGDRVNMTLWQANLLGGSGTGSMRFDAAKKTIHFEGTGENLLLERWLRERGKDAPFTGGPMRVRMAIDMRGDTWRDLAASVTGPVSIRMGPGSYARKGAAEWESLMVAFTKKEATGAIEFECAAANLHFESGIARGDSIVGARSNVSRLLTSGVVDLREEHVDLRGKLRTAPGSIGLSAIANDLQIEGPLRKLQTRLDPEKKPVAIAKGVAAVATAGLSLLAGSAANAAKAGEDPCAIVPTGASAAQTAMASSR